MDAHEIIERYLHAIERQLPRRQRADISLELRSLLTDMLEERAAQAGRLADAALAAEVLREFGQPDEVAARYRPTRHLISPDYYPAFVKVTGVVQVVLAGLFIAAFFFTLAQTRADPSRMAHALFEVVANYLGYALTNLGLMVVIFAAIERFERRRPETPAAWNPLDLPAVVDPDKISRRDQIAAIALRLALILIFNFFPGLIAFFFFTDGQWGRWPLLTPEFRASLVPWLSLLWVLEAALAYAVLRQGRWRTATRWAELILNVAGLVVVYRVLTGEAMLTPPIFDIGVRIGLAIAFVIGVAEVVYQFYRLLTRRLTVRQPWAAPRATP